MWEIAGNQGGYHTMKTYKTKWRLLLCAVATTAAMATAAGASDFDACADKLKTLGLFEGTGQSYELDRAPTRAEAAVMLVRLLGQEDAAKALSYTAPFTDVADWQKPYVQYLYENKLASGTSDSIFSPNEACSAQMYTTFLLRALGYQDGANGDFTSDNALAFAESNHLIDYINCDTENFLRDHVAAMTLTALHTPSKGANTSLLNTLTASNAVSKDKAASLTQFFSDYDSYMAVASDEETKMDMELNINASVKAAGAELLTLTMPFKVQADVDMEHFNQTKMAMTGSLSIVPGKLLSQLAGEEDLKELENLNQAIQYYYTDGNMYMQMDGEKMKMPLALDEMMEAIQAVKSMDATQNEIPISLVKSVQKTDNAWTVSYDTKVFNSLVNDMMTLMLNLDDTDSIDDNSVTPVDISNITMKTILDNNKLSAMDLALDMAMTIEEVKVDINMTCNYKINATGDDVTVTLPADLNTYTDLLSVIPVNDAVPEV